MNENVVLSVSNALCSEFSEDMASLTAKYLICNFEPNENGVMLNRKTIINWISTLIDQPVVAKIGLTDNGVGDFTSHNMHLVVREDTDGNAYQDYEFNTEACGVFTSVEIETIDGKDCITATAKLWKRFPNFISVIRRRIEENIPISTSWEIATKKFHYEMINGKKIKILDDGQFLGHCMLSKVTPPAYKDSQLLEVATKENNGENELLDALSKDLSIEKSSNISMQKEDENLENEVINSEENEEKKVEDTSTEETITNSEVNDNSENDVSALTEYDLRKALRQAIAEKLNIDKWEFYIVYNFPTDGVVWIQKWDSESELDIIQFTYTAENDVVIMSEPIEAKLSVSVSQINTKVAELDAKIEEQTSSLLEANTVIQNLNKEISALTPFKESFEKAEQDRIEQETSAKREALKGYAIKSGFITEEDIDASEDIKSYIEQVNEKEIRAIIAERFMKSLDDKPVETSAIETSEKKTEVVTPQAKINITDDGTDSVVNPNSIMKKFINK